MTSGDINQDGSLDVYISNYRLENNNLYINDGSGPGTPPFSVPDDMFFPFSDEAGAYNGSNFVIDRGSLVGSYPNLPPDPER